MNEKPQNPAATQNGARYRDLDRHDLAQPRVHGDRPRPCWLTLNELTDPMQRDPGAASLILLAAALLAGVLVLSDHALSDSHRSTLGTESEKLLAVSS